MTEITLATMISATILFLVLCEASVADIKTTYLPDKCIFEIYLTAVVFVVAKTIIGGFGELITAVISFVIIAVAYGVILLIENIRRKRAKKDENEFVPDEQKKSVSGKINKDFGHIAGLIIFAMVVCTAYGSRTLYDFVYPWQTISYLSLFAVMPLLCGFVFLILKKSGRRIRKHAPLVVMGVFGVTMLSAFVYAYWNTYGIGTLLAVGTGACIYGLMFFLSKFLKNNFAEKTDNDGYIIENEEEQEEEKILVFGGGDALILGAVALMFGAGSIIPIFIYSGIACLFINLGRKIHKQTAFNAPVAFIPSLTFGIISYIMGFSLIR